LEHLEMTVRIAAAVAAGDDCGEAQPAVAIGRLQAAQVVLGRQVVERVSAGRVVLPQVDGVTGERGATRAVTYELPLELARDACGAAAQPGKTRPDVAAHDGDHRQHVDRTRAAVGAVRREGTLDLARGGDARLGARLRAGAAVARGQHDSAEPERQTAEHPPPVELELAGHVAVASATSSRASALDQSYPPSTRQPSLPSES